MEFRFETRYDAKAMTAMARAMRKTVRKKRSRRSHVFGWIVIGLAALLTAAERPFVWEGRDTLNTVIVAVLLAVLLFEDRLNGWIAKKRMLPGLDASTVVFSQEGYHSVTAMGESQFFYDKIDLLAETDGYFVFLFGKHHGQIYDKATLEGGTAEEFRQFLQEKTGKEIRRIK